LIRGIIMLVWTGWGIVAIPIFALGLLGGTSLGTALGLGAPGQTNLGTALGCALASAAVWLIGTRLNRPRPSFDPQTGAPAQVGNMHRLWFLPIQYLGVLGSVGAVVLAVVALTTG
jgi:hypothetical protein